MMTKEHSLRVTKCLPGFGHAFIILLVFLELPLLFYIWVIGYDFTWDKKKFGFNLERKRIPETTITKEITRTFYIKPEDMDVHSHTIH